MRDSSTNQSEKLRADPSSSSYANTLTYVGRHSQSASLSLGGWDHKPFCARTTDMIENKNTWFMRIYRHLTRELSVSEKWFSWQVASVRNFNCKKCDYSANKNVIHVYKVNFNILPYVRFNILFTAFQLILYILCIILINIPFLVQSTCNILLSHSHRTKCWRYKYQNDVCRIYCRNINYILVVFSLVIIS